MLARRKTDHARAAKAFAPRIVPETSRPKLSGAIEERMKGILRELSMAKGNLLGTKKDIRTVYVTSCHDAEGKTTTAIALAYGLAVTGNSKVLLVDANSRSPRLHLLFGTDIGPGISDLPKSGLFTANLMRPTSYKNLSLMTYGSLAPKFSSDAVPYFLKQINCLRNHYDFIIVDGNSIIGTSETVLISELFDGVILTVESEKTRYEVAETAVSRIKNIGGNILGAVMNKRKYYIPELIYGMR